MQGANFPTALVIAAICLEDQLATDADSPGLPKSLSLLLRRARTFLVDLPDNLADTRDGAPSVELLFRFTLLRVGVELALRRGEALPLDFGPDFDSWFDLDFGEAFPSPGSRVRARFFGMLKVITMFTIERKWEWMCSGLFYEH